MDHRANAIVAALSEPPGPDYVDSALIHHWLTANEDPHALVNALPAALVGADPLVVQVLQQVLDQCNPGTFHLQKDIDNLAHNIEPGDTRHAKRARRA
jgi:hypothetical protein